MHNVLRQTFGVRLVYDVILLELFVAQVLIIDIYRVEVFGHQLGLLLIGDGIGWIFGGEDISIADSCAAHHDLIVVLISLFLKILEFHFATIECQWILETFLADSTEIFCLIELVLCEYNFEFIFFLVCALKFAFNVLGGYDIDPLDLDGDVGVGHLQKILDSSPSGAIWENFLILV